MKIFLDNELESYRRLVSIIDRSAENIYDVLDILLNALQAYGFSEDLIKEAMLHRCYEWGLIEPIKDEDLE